MRNVDLARDHLKRARARLTALDALFGVESWADVVRESQEVVELSLKGLLRAHGVEPPRGRTRGAKRPLSSTGTYSSR